MMIKIRNHWVFPIIIGILGYIAIILISFTYESTMM